MHGGQKTTPEARNGGRVAAGLNPIAVALAPGGRFLYVANWGAHDVSAYQIEPTTGALAQIGGSPFASGRWPHSIAIAPGGRFLFTGNVREMANRTTFRAIAFIRRPAR
jgi:6-phosphogluconolactonase (cycloisomerase 2 family)